MTFKGTTLDVALYPLHFLFLSGAAAFVLVDTKQGVLFPQCRFSIRGGGKPLVSWDRGRGFSVRSSVDPSCPNDMIKHFLDLCLHGHEVFCHRVLAHGSWTSVCFPHN
jgi:hypothetical protein